MNDLPFRRQYRVRWRDADASGFVYFANYVRLMEETEYAWLRTRGLCSVTHDERGVIGFPRIRTEIEIGHPACVDDDLEIRLLSAQNDGVQIDYQFEIATGNEIVATGHFAVACCRFERHSPPRAILIPDFMRERLGPAIE
ncbi:MAG: acyl-CoA thioesterase [Pirellulaceae bacterium]